jgi:hypothetical protein
MNTTATRPLQIDKLTVKCPTLYSRCPTCHLYSGGKCAWDAFRQGYTVRQDFNTPGIEVVHG